MIGRVAFLALHTSPLLQPGVGSAGGMNVYIDELARTMVGRGVAVDLFTRAAAPGLPAVVEVVPGYRVVHVVAGPPRDTAVLSLAPHVRRFAEEVIREVQAGGSDYDVVHSHYWLSGWAGLLVKRARGLPLANSFHTLGRIKDATRRPGEPHESLLRIAAEEEVIAGSDCVIASTPVEAEDLIEHYGAEPSRLCVSPPGVNHDIFNPGPQQVARAELGIEDGPLLLFVGRVQPLKGLDVAVAALRHIRDRLPDTRLLVVGGPSGPRGNAELLRVRELAAGLGLDGAITFRPAQPHGTLAAFYRAADVLLFPSRSESFGLVAVEAQACGLPVVAADVGGLSHAVAHEASGFLVAGWEPSDHAAAALRILEDRELALQMSKQASEFAAEFSWDATADRLLELYDGITGSD